MTQQESITIKVYELAKELGMDSISLLDKFKKIDIEVKSHMSSVDSESAQAVKDFLKKEAISKSKSTKKKTARRKTAKKVSTKDSETKTAGTKSSAKSKTKDAAPAKVTATKRKVIKRRVAKTEDTEAIAKEASAETEKATINTQASPAIQQSASESKTASSMEAKQSSATKKTEAPTANAEASAKQASEELAESATKKPTRKTLQGLEQDEMASEFATRRLKIIQEAPPQSKESKPSQNTNTDSANPTDVRSATQNKEMFKPVTTIINKEEENKKKSSSLVKKTKDDVRISDFMRKREIIFQPKRRKLPPGKVVKQTQITTPSAAKRVVKMEDKITVSDLAKSLKEKTKTIIKKLETLGLEEVNAELKVDFDTASLLVADFNYEIENVTFDETKLLTTEEEKDQNLKARPATIAVMGHVDHGKTTLLDALRSASVAAGEAGGITQHIGAYSVKVDKNYLTFLDTPGHSAFESIRQRGANITDLVILVVAADDSVMPQTVEAIKHAKNAGVPMIVAANKMDRPDANLDKLKQNLSEHEVLCEDWGGEVPLVPISALKKEGLDDLLETVNLHTEMMELKANPDCPAEGVVIEARLQKGRGVIADLLLKNGSLKSGDHIVCGLTFGRVKQMMNDQGKVVKSIGAGFPIEIAGLNDVPLAGDSFVVTKNEKDAKEIIAHRKDKMLAGEQEKREADAAAPTSLDDLFKDVPLEGDKQFNIMIKSDVYGSLEALKSSIDSMQSEKIKIKIISANVGVITENDILMADTASAQIYGFNVKPDSKSKSLAKTKDVEVKSFKIIYELLDNVKESMEALLDPIRIETPLGKLEVKQGFMVSKIGQIAGGIVLDGKMARNAFARVMRKKDMVAEGNITSLKRFKDDAKETIKGQECGVAVEHYNDIQAGDIIEAFNVTFKKDTL